MVTHHPLLLRGVHSVAATTPKSGLPIHRMITNGIALRTAHTNADRADPGVSDALARAVGLTGDLRPMVPADDDPRRGLGRIGELDEPVTLREFTERAAAGLPSTAWGVRAAGDPDAVVRTVAVCGGWATLCSTRCSTRGGPLASTSTSPQTCGTTPPRSSPSTAAPPWWTPRTGRPNGRGWPTPSAYSPRPPGSGQVGDTGVHARHRRVAPPRRRSIVKAAPQAQLRLIDLQDLDSSLDRLAHRRRTLPELAEIERLEGRLTELRDAVVAAETEVGDLQREQRKAEQDVDQVRTRADRDRQRLSTPGR